MAAAFGDLSELAWSPWVALEGAGRGSAIPTLPGLYRIRSVETGRTLYIGQTGRSLKERMGALKGVYGDVMPYNDPHTAGPALWAHRIEFGETFEVSVAVLEVDKADRMGREARSAEERRNSIDGLIDIGHDAAALLDAATYEQVHADVSPSPASKPEVRDEANHAELRRIGCGCLLEHADLARGAVVNAGPVEDGEDHPCAEQSLRVDPVDLGRRRFEVGDCLVWDEDADAA
jgi:hypothetical protein